MIDKLSFANGMGILAGAFGRQVDEPVSRAYYLVLSRELTTEEFEAAVTRCVSEETFWPSPAVLIGKVKQKSDALRALADTERRVWASGGYLHFPASEYAKLPDAVKRGLSAAGGLAALRGAEGRTRERLERAFVEAYDEAIAGGKVLPASTRDRQLPAGERVSDDATSEDEPDVRIRTA